MKIIINKMRSSMNQPISLILENKSEIFDTKDKNLFILPLLFEMRRLRVTSVMARGLPWIIAHLGVF